MAFLTSCLQFEVFLIIIITKKSPGHTVFSYVKRHYTGKFYVKHNIKIIKYVGIWFLMSSCLVYRCRYHSLLLKDEYKVQIDTNRPSSPAWLYQYCAAVVEVCKIFNKSSFYIQNTDRFVLLNPLHIHSPYKKHVLNWVQPIATVLLITLECSLCGQRTL